MKLVTFLPPEGESSASGIWSRLTGRIGAVLPDGRILDFARGDASLAKISMVDFIRDAPVHRSRAEALAAMSDELPRNVLRAPELVSLLAPIPRPLTLRDGYAFRRHVETARRNRGLPMIPEFDRFPVFYFGNPLSVLGPGELRVGGRQLEQLDFELEAFAVVGRKIRNPTLRQADDAIFGYGVMNDFSARALQMEEMKLNLGPAKGKDFATALGPWLVTKDELADRISPSPKGNVLWARMTAHVNGVQVSDGNLGQMDWTFAQIVQRAADGVTLEAGEVIGSGTVGTGCFLELNGSKATQDQWLEPGDEVSLTIEGLGTLTNMIVADESR